VLFVHTIEIGDVVSVIAIWGRVEGLQPQTGDAESLEVVKPAHQALEVADAVPIGVLIFLDVETVDDGVLVPEVGNGHGSSRCKSRDRKRRAYGHLYRLNLLDDIVAAEVEAAGLTLTSPSLNAQLPFMTARI
jgi:hypothetical protein